MAVVSVYAVFRDRSEAERIGRTVIDERLAACINILGPCRSIYRWQGAVEQSDEVPAILKTEASAAEALVARIAELHCYAVPAIAVWPVTHTHAGYAKWVEVSVG